jgi:hypothetical protein
MKINKMFWTLSHDGTEVLRDLKKENETFSVEKYINGEFDANNFQWYEMFHHFVYDDLGCDYERYGCYIREGDVVLDLGGNIGVFAHRAEERMERLGFKHFTLYHGDGTLRTINFWKE